ncbi:hypothetical protein NECAME_18122, partial [Necator americanus]
MQTKRPDERKRRFRRSAGRGPQTCKDARKDAADVKTRSRAARGSNQFGEIDEGAVAVGLCFVFGAERLLAVRDHLEPAACRTLYGDTPVPAAFLFEYVQPRTRWLARRLKNIHLKPPVVGISSRTMAWIRISLKTSLLRRNTELRGRENPEASRIIRALPRLLFGAWQTQMPPATLPFQIARQREPDDDRNESSNACRVPVSARSFAACSPRTAGRTHADPAPAAAKPRTWGRECLRQARRSHWPRRRRQQAAQAGVSGGRSAGCGRGHHHHRGRASVEPRALDGGCGGASGPEVRTRAHACRAARGLRVSGERQRPARRPARRTRARPARRGQCAGIRPGARRRAARPG